MEQFGLVNEKQAQRSFIVQVYMWMTLALLTTAFVAFFTASSPSLCELILGNSMVFYGLAITEFLLVLALSSIINKMPAVIATAVFFIYAILNGLTFSALFLVYDLGSIAYVFFVTAVTFGVMCAYGYFTKSDLSSIGSICFMGLIGLIIATIANYFITNDVFTTIVSYIGVVIFVLLTAYDTQKIKKLSMSASYSQDVEGTKKASIIGALTLYLDFINLFIYILRILGKKK